MTYHASSRSSSQVQIDRLPILLLRTNQGTWVGLQVSQALGEQELAIRSLHSALTAPAYIQGCTILGNNQLALVLDIQILLNRVSNRSSSGLRLSAISAPQGVQNDGKPSGKIASTEGSGSGSGSDKASLGISASKGQPKLSLSPRLGQRALVIDDSLTQRRTLERTLQTAGYETFQAEDGLDALAKLRQVPEVSVIICDLEMPRMNGFEFLSEARKMPELAAIPIVILTSRSGAKYRQLAMELGASQFLSKPYGDRELLQAIADLQVATQRG
jgi:two-component system, chemotaxis family, sensor histidine kinase and response regulator PixL